MSTLGRVPLIGLLRMAGLAAAGLFYVRSTGLAVVRLDKKNQRQLRAALGAAGFEVETLTED